jgi:predicted membrane-bound spermidine synthase
MQEDACQPHRDPWQACGRRCLYGLVTAGGAAALAWEAIWQLKISLSLGISAIGTAITLAVTMAGISIGSLAMGRWLRNRRVQHPVRLYGLLELGIGLTGLLLGALFVQLEALDSSLYEVWPAAAFAWYLLGITLILGPPTLAMGASIPLFGLLARRFRSSIALLYGLNTLGAAAGVLAMAFLILPTVGVFWSCVIIATINSGIFFAAWLLEKVSYEPRQTSPTTTTSVATTSHVGASVSTPVAALVVFFLLLECRPSIDQCCRYPWSWTRGMGGSKVDGIRCGKLLSNSRHSHCI